MGPQGEDDEVNGEGESGLDEKFRVGLFVLDT